MGLGFGAVDRSLPRSERSELSVGEVVATLVASRLRSPSPLYDIAGWASGAAVRELLGIPPQLLNDDRLGRGLERFAGMPSTCGACWPPARLSGSALTRAGCAWI